MSTAVTSSASSDKPPAETRESSLGSIQGMTREEVIKDAEEIAHANGLGDRAREFVKGALVASSNAETPDEIEAIDELDDRDISALCLEWNASPLQCCSWTMFWACVLCAGCAIVQGMDQTIINGAQDFYMKEFGYQDSTMMRGLTNGAPYITAAFFGIPSNMMMNKWLKRRGTIFFCCFIALSTAISQAFAFNYHMFLLSRLSLGTAVGPMSSTTPVYCAETAPARLRGRMTMLWQTFTAFGIMIGMVVSLGCLNANISGFPSFGGEDPQWRLMILLSGVPPLIVLLFVYALPESPRACLNTGDIKGAYESFCKLRKSHVAACRDLYRAIKAQEAEKAAETKVGWKEGVRQQLQRLKRGRILRAMQSAYFVMIMQQMCGVNAIAYYSTSMFKELGHSLKTAMIASVGFGAINFLFAGIAFFTIDRFGRRPLLTWTFPFMAICLLTAGGGYKLEEVAVRSGLTLPSIFIFTMFYSVGPGPVTFGYAAEVFPLEMRATLMATATSLTWCLNFVVSFTWPEMVETMGLTGAFILYGIMNIVGWLYSWFVLPETKNISLEEMDKIFSTQNRVQINYHWKLLQNRFRRCMGRQPMVVEPLNPTAKPPRAQNQPPFFFSVDSV